MSGVDLKIDDGLAIITLDNEAKLNALTIEMLSALDEHIGMVEKSDDLRALIVTGKGSKAFCCGADIAAWGSLSPAEFARHWVRNGHRLFDRLAGLHLPTIAALNGHTFGGGLELAACCDIRFMAPNATLALPEARVGVVPGWSGTQRLLRLMPEPMVKEMALFGRRIDADRAFGAGFVCNIADDVLGVAIELTQQQAGLSPRATEISKSMIHAAREENSAAMIEALGSAAIAASEDRQEGVAAFLDKRTAEFSGK